MSKKFKQKFRMFLRKMSIHAKKFRIEKTFCVAGMKKTNKYYVQSHFGTSEICLFYTGHKKCLFIMIFFNILKYV